MKPHRYPTRYTVPVGPENEYQPGSGRRVLRNHLGISRKSELDAAEFEYLVKVQARYLERVITGDTRFTAKLICQMHRDWLDPIYPWAGKYRSVELSKDGFTWPPAYLISRNMDALQRGALRRHTPCRPASLDIVAHRIAEVHAELMLIHPFREGNGRLGRWIADLMAFQAGLPAPSPAFRFSGRGSRQGRTQYIQAVNRGFDRDYEDLAAFFALAIESRL